MNEKDPLQSPSRKKSNGCDLVRTRRFSAHGSSFRVEPTPEKESRAALILEPIEAFVSLHRDFTDKVEALWRALFLLWSQIDQESSRAIERYKAITGLHPIIASPRAGESALVENDLSRGGAPKVHVDEQVGKGFEAWLDLLTRRVAADTAAADAAFGFLQWAMSILDPLEELLDLVEDLIFRLEETQARINLLLQQAKTGFVPSRRALAIDWTDEGSPVNYATELVQTEIKGSVDSLYPKLPPLMDDPAMIQTLAERSQGAARNTFEAYRTASQVCFDAG